MQAAIFKGPNRITVEEVKIPGYSYYNRIEDDKEAVLKVNACGVCAYDSRVYRNGHPKVIPPMILGHEICGEFKKTMTANTPNMIINNGSSRRVVVSPAVPCLNCYYCNNKQYNLCINLKEIGSSVNGGFAEYIKVPREILQVGGLIPVPDNLSDEEATLLEPLSCCLSGFSHIDINTVAKKEAIFSVVILGDGPIGLLHLQLSKLLLPHAKTIVVGKVPARIQKAKSLGADATIVAANNNDNDVKITADEVFQATNGIGANLVVVTTSNPAALDVALKVASKNSKINVFAGMPKETRISLDPNWLHYNQISVTGSFSSTPAMLHKAARLAANRQVDLSKIITHRYSLDNIQEALLATEKYYGLRVVINKF
jgi:L-iditol 2-dehydrogenase